MRGLRWDTSICRLRVFRLWKTTINVEQQTWQRVYASRCEEKIQTGKHKAKERSFMKASRILLIFPALVFVYIILYHSFYFELYPLSTVDPYLYYSYSPGFWAVDISFWIFSPLMYLTFRKKYEGRILSIIYTLCMDASAVGAFLVFFSLVYGVDIFASHYYIYGFVLMLLFVLPIEHIKANKKLLWININDVWNYHR